MDKNPRAAPLSWIDLPSLFPGFDQPGVWLPLLERHWALIEAAATRVNVTAVPAVEAVRRHYAECLEIWRIARAAHERGGPLVDIGSGGGFPGLVVAALDRGVEVHLIEPLQKRARLLREMASALDLGNVTVHGQRAEEAGRGPLRERGAIVTARAVAELRVLLEYGSPLAEPGGVLVFPRGSGSRVADLAAVADGVDSATSCRLLQSEPVRPEINANLTVLTFLKTGPAPDGLPRRPGTASRQPLKGSSA